MNTVKILSSIIEDPAFASFITDVKVFPEREGTYKPLPADLDARLSDSCIMRGMNKLYAHQAEAYESVRSGKHTVIVTPTASGKTLTSVINEAKAGSSIIFERICTVFIAS